MSKGGSLIIKLQKCKRANSEIKAEENGPKMKAKTWAPQK